MIFGDCEQQPLKQRLPQQLQATIMYSSKYDLLKLIRAKERLL
jgi:hypothetical protein